MANYITADGLKKLAEELEYLKNVKRKELAERLKKAISFGDLSENFDYADAKEQQQFVESRIAELEQLMSTSSMVSTHTKQSGKVQIGSRVTLKSGEEISTFTITGAQEANPLEGKISGDSPIGSALLGKKEGQEARVETPSGTTTYEILKIE